LIPPIADRASKRKAKVQEKIAKETEKDRRKRAGNADAVRKAHHQVQ
jgi:hypothetical protein